MARPNPDAAARDALQELAAENDRLRRLVGELLLKNQRLREAAPSEHAGCRAAVRRNADCW